MSIDLTLQKWAIFIMGVYGENLCLLSDPFWLYKKHWHTPWKFQLEITSNKKVIAKKPLTNLYEMNSNLVLIESSVRQCWARYLSPITQIRVYTRWGQWSVSVSCHRSVAAVIQMSPTILPDPSVQHFSRTTQRR